MDVVERLRWLALVGELHRAGRLLHGDPHAYSDLIVQLETILGDLEELELDDGRPLAEEFSDA